MTRILRQLGIPAMLAASLSFSACQSPQGGETLVPRKSAIVDSAYNARLTSWLRDSVVLDSMTRLVNTDSLYKLYRRALEPPGVTLALMTEVQCEEVRLEIRFGSIPGSRAIRAVEDTMYRDHGIRDGMGYFIAHAPREGVIETGRSRCGPYPPAAPRAIGTTRLDTDLPQRPRPPRA